MSKSDVVQIRVSPQEKQAFQDAASGSGLALSAWMRERLRRAARIELEDAGRKVAFAMPPEDQD